MVDDIEIKDQNGNILYTLDAISNNSKLNVADVCVDINNIILIYKLTEIQYDLNDLKELEIGITNVKLLKENEIINENGFWDLNLNI